MHKILVVDDELSIRESFSLILEDHYHVLQAASGEAALKMVSDQKVDLAYLDIRMPGMDGIEALGKMKSLDPELEIIMVTAVNDVQKASQAVKLGARNYIVKPFDVNNVLKLSEQLLRRKAILSQSGDIQKKRGKAAPEMVGQNEKMIALAKKLEKIRDQDRVLITGEPGTEKDLIARMIHERSKRAGAPFRSIRLSQEMSPAEMSCHLFGREKGASTADLEARAGLLEETQEGTLFIDNLEALHPDVFRPLASLSFSRVGLGMPARESGGAKIQVGTRLIGGAAIDLNKKSREVFEFFSMAVADVPPLRERSSDIPTLIDHFLQIHNSRFGRDVRIANDAVDKLAAYAWPGNTEELGSLLERLVLSSADEKITAEELPFDILLKTAEGAGGNFISAFEDEYIRRAFEKKGKDKERTAAFLAVNPILLESKL